MAEVVIWGIAAAGGPAIAAGSWGYVAVQLGVAVASSALSVALASKAANANRSGGVRTESITAGDQSPQSFVLGRTMTAGNLAAPEMSHGVSGDKRYLTRVVDLGDLPYDALESLIIDGDEATLGTSGTLTMSDGDGTTPAINSTFGATVQTPQRYTGFAWCRFYDGSQTSADADLVSIYGSYPERPWSSDMIGRGVPYAILTFLLRDTPQIWQGRPDVKFIVRGIKLYDPRKDTTAGGSGAHRYANQATWEWSENPVVMIYNILRGIPLPDGNVYGGGYGAADLPYATWVAGMNACDALISGRKTYIAGYEVRIGTPDIGGDAPLDVIDQLLKACSAEIADVGGTMFVRVGGPAMPVKYITDEDILRSQPQDLDPFPPLENTYNGVHATYPDPAQLWAAREAPPRYDTTAQTEDGQILIGDITLPAVTNRTQVQQLMRAWLKDARRFRTHNIGLPPEGLLVNPLDVIDWTSTRNGYPGKDFEVSQVGIDPRTLCTTLSIREKDSGDYAWVVGDEIATTAPSAVGVVTSALSVAGWTVTGVTVPDAGGNARRPAIRISWTAPVPGIDRIRWKVRVTATEAEVTSGISSVVDGTQIITAGILSATSYQVTARYQSGYSTSWTAWTTVTSGTAFISAADFSGGTIPAVDLSGVLDIARFATGIRPVEVLGALPTTGNFAGRMVFLTTDSKLYRHTGSPSGSAGYTKATDGADITANTITAGQIAAGAIGATEIAAGAVIASKIAVSDFTNLVPDNDITDQGSWNTGTGGEFSVVSPTSVTGTDGTGMVVRNFVAGTGDKISDGLDFKVRPNREYWASYQIRRSGGTQLLAYMQVRFSDKDGAAISATTIDNPGISTLTGVQNREAAIVSPANAVKARIRWVVAAASTDSTVQFFAPQLRPRNRGELIVDGAISANQIAANAITAGKISANAIDTDSLIVGGAVSRRVYSYGVLSSTVNTTVKTITTRNFGTSKFKAYAGTAGDRDNPIHIVVSGYVQASVATTGWVSFTVDVDVFLSGAWTNVHTTSFSVPTGFPTVREPFMGTNVLDISTPQNWSQVRVTIERGAAGGGTFDEAYADVMLTQISV